MAALTIKASTAGATHKRKRELVRQVREGSRKARLVRTDAGFWVGVQVNESVKEWVLVLLWHPVATAREAGEMSDQRLNYQPPVRAVDLRGIPSENYQPMPGGGWAVKTAAT